MPYAFPTEFRSEFLKNFIVVCKIPTRQVQLPNNRSLFSSFFFFCISSGQNFARNSVGKADDFFMKVREYEKENSLSELISTHCFVYHGQRRNQIKPNIIRQQVVALSNHVYFCQAISQAYEYKLCLFMVCNCFEIVVSRQVRITNC